MKYLKILVITAFFIMSGFTMTINAQRILKAEPVSGKSLTKNIINHHMIYPNEALSLKKGGKVVVSLDIDKNGISSNYKIINSFDESCSEEAIRLLKQILWNPATRDGISMASNQEYTIDFSPKSYSRYIAKNPRVQIPKQNHPIQKSNKIFNIKDLNKIPTPYFENPNITFGAYLRSELVYPDQAKEFEISGTVILSFIIEEDGLVSNIVVEQSVGGGCDNEAIRLIQNSTWIPGVKNDSIVRTRYSQEITFQFGERNYHEGNRY